MRAGTAITSSQRGFAHRGGRGGASRSGAAAARARPTHFLCIPLATASSRPQLAASLARFRRAVADDNRAAARAQAQARATGSFARLAAIPEAAVRPVGTLHLTLGVMSLPGEDEVRRAREALAGLDLAGLLSAAAEASPARDAPTAAAAEQWGPALAVSLRSLASMHPPRDTSVLYAEPRDASGRLQRFGEALRDAFVRSGLVLAEDRPLKLHATVLNTVYAKSGRNAARVDATGLLRECRDFEWCGEFVVEKIAICRMGGREVRDSTGEVVDVAYEEVASKAMPQMNNS
jgi:activating signal cointegrator complex subunit 1